MVVFVNSKPSKKDYHKVQDKKQLSVQTVCQEKSFAGAMVSTASGLTPPDLIVIDGGQGQVNIAKQSHPKELGLDIPTGFKERQAPNP